MKATNPGCTHSRVTKEYYGGFQTGDLKCLDCGDSFEPAAWVKAARPSAPEVDPEEQQQRQQDVEAEENDHSS